MGSRNVPSADPAADFGADSGSDPGGALTVRRGDRGALAGSRADNAPRRPEATIGDEIRTLAAALWRRKHWIALAGLVSLLAGLVFLAVTPPRYLATAQILIDPRSKRVVEGAVVQGGFGSSAVGADTLLIDSQVELVTSTAILRRVAEATSLATDPEFAMTRGEGLRIKLRNWFGGYRPGYAREVAPVADPLETAIYRLRDKHLSVRRVGNTYVINVSVFSEVPDKSARLANAVASAYVRDQVTAATDTTRATTALLQARIAELRDRVEIAERAVEDYRGKNGLIGTSGGLVNEQQLQSTNEKLSVARTATALAKARSDIVRGLTPTSAVLSAQSDALRSPVVQALRQNLARLERREAVLQQTLGPRHPDFAGVQAERRSITALIGDELGRIRINAQSEYDLAVANEKALATEFAALQTRASTDNQAGVKLRELSRESQSARLVYEAFLTRVKETREQEDLAREQSRIIGEATTPSFAASPPTALVLVGSLGAGLLLGALLAWLAHVLERPAFTDGAVGNERDVTEDDRRTMAVADGIDMTAAEREAELAEARRGVRAARGFRSDDHAAMAAGGLATNRMGRGTIRTDERRAAPDGRPPARQVAPAAGARSEPDSRPMTLKVPVLAVSGPGGAHLKLGAGQVITFADHIAAVDTDGPDRDDAYTAAIEVVLADASRSSDHRSPAIAALIGIDGGVGTSSAALALAYRSAMLGHRTLLIDAAFATAELSLIFAAEHIAIRAEDIRNRNELRALIVRDARSGLAFLPLAATEPDRLDDDARAVLVAHVRTLFAEFDCVLIDAGHGLGDAITVALLALSTRVLLACPEYDLEAVETRTAIRALGPAARRTRVLATLARRRPVSAAGRPLSKGGRAADVRI